MLNKHTGDIFVNYLIVFWWLVITFYISYIFASTSVYPRCFGEICVAKSLVFCVVFIFYLYWFCVLCPMLSVSLEFAPGLCSGLSSSYVIVWKSAVIQIACIVITFYKTFVISFISAGRKPIGPNCSQTLELSTLGCSSTHNNTLQALQRTIRSSTS